MQQKVIEIFKWSKHCRKKGSAESYYLVEFCHCPQLQTNDRHAQGWCWHKLVRYLCRIYWEHPLTSLISNQVHIKNNLLCYIESNGEVSLAKFWIETFEVKSLWPEVMAKGTEGHSVVPTAGEVCDVHTLLKNETSWYFCSVMVSRQFYLWVICSKYSNSVKPSKENFFNTFSS